MADLSERKVLIVGASSGIGSGLSVELSRAGALVGLAARRIEKLKETAAACAGPTTIIECDVRRPEHCLAVVERCVSELGGLDALIYAAGSAKFVEATKARSEDWQSVLETNVIGAALVTSAAIDHLTAAKGHAVFFSSVSAKHLPPWRGTATYVASKRALEALVQSLRLENPDVAFTTVVVGPTASEFGMDDLENLSRFSADWATRQQLAFSEILDPSDHAQIVLQILSGNPRTSVSEVVIEPR